MDRSVALSFINFIVGAIIGSVVIHVRGRVDMVTVIIVLLLCVIVGFIIGAMMTML